MAAAAVGLGLLLLPAATSTLSRLGCAVVGAAYPAFRSFEAMKADDKEGQKKWLTYWTVYGAVRVLETVAEPLLFWLPGYNAIKLAFLISLQLPIIEGAKRIYEEVMDPFLTKHKPQIDKFLNNTARETAGFLKRHSKDLAQAANFLGHVSAALIQVLQTVLFIDTKSVKKGDDDAAPPPPPVTDAPAS